VQNGEQFRADLVPTSQKREKEETSRAVGGLRVAMEAPGNGANRTAITGKGDKKFSFMDWELSGQEKKKSEKNQIPSIHNASKHIGKIKARMVLKVNRRARYIRRNMNRKSREGKKAFRYGSPQTQGVRASFGGQIRKKKGAIAYRGVKLREERIKKEGGVINVFEMHGTSSIDWNCRLSLELKKEATKNSVKGRGEKGTCIEA